MAENQSAPTQIQGSPSTGTSSGGRTTQSCAECRRRRIRCDGQQVPCQQCLYYRVPERCHYPQRRSRQTPSAKAYADLCSAHEKSQDILNKLFPGETIDRLHRLTRQQLFEHLGDTSPPSAESEQSDPLCGSPTATILQLESSPYQEHGWDETPDGRPPCEDDVNGMSALFTTGSHLYLGISSVRTIMRVMAHTSPGLQQAIQERPASDSAAGVISSVEQSSSFPTFDEPVLIDAYFRTVHAVTPMIDELDFRQSYAGGGCSGHARKPWLALLNMVLTMGYIAANDDTQDGHAFFYDRAAEHLGFACFATGHIYTLQALALLGGYYLHFINKPNMASAVMGAAHRMAVALGLHRLIPVGDSPPSHQIANESRLRTWWCLLCLDTWAGTTLGRLEPGLWNLSSKSGSTAQVRVDHDFTNLSMSASASFSLIAARIQDRMVRLPLMTPLELKRFDDELLAWRDTLHPVLRSGRHGPESVRLAGLLLNYRYLNQMMLLHRPYLLIQSIKAGLQDDLSSDYINSNADACCKFAQDSIRDIAESWYPSQLLAWNASWFLFQAALVVLLRLLSGTYGDQSSNLEASVIQCLASLEQMRTWRGSAAQTHDLISFIFNARGTGEQGWRFNSLPDGALMDLLSFDAVAGGDWAELLDASGGFSQEQAVFTTASDAPS